MTSAFVLGLVGLLTIDPSSRDVEAHARVTECAALFELAADLRARDHGAGSTSTALENYSSAYLIEARRLGGDDATAAAFAQSLSAFDDELRENAPLYFAVEPARVSECVRAVR